MERFSDLTDEQVLGLTDEQVSHYCDIECAESGVALVPMHPGPEPAKLSAQPDREYFDVDGVMLANREEAATLAGVITSMRRVTTNYAPGGDYTHQILVDNPRDVLVQVKRQWSPEAWDSHKKLILEHKAKQEAWKKETDAYSKALQDRASAVAWVYDRISELRDAAATRHHYREMLGRYLLLANGDEQIARNFLLKAYPDARNYLDPMAPQEA